jgi:ubiquinone/menaquinone biosynthesis C-methylase UbiE
MALAPHAPNHHGSHPGFSGLGGLVAGLTMIVGRGGDARLAAQLTGLGAGDRVVDVGCGPGTAARSAARQGATVTAVDPATVMLALARRLTPPGRRITYLEGVADDSATVLWSIATVHHWPHLATGLSEARRVLRADGRFLAIERRTRPGAKGLASHGWTDEQAAAFAEHCRAAGFDDVAVERHVAGRRSLVAVTARST